MQQTLSAARRPRRWWRRGLALFALAYLAPLGSYAAYSVLEGWPASWRSANWSSAGLLPQADSRPEAQVYLLASRVGRWRGIFAHHSWIVLKPAGARQYIRYDVVGWGQPVRRNSQVADGRWYGNDPEIMVHLSGDAATRAIGAIDAAISTYPYSRWGDYRIWPGPNSNSFIAHIAAAEPALAPGLLPTALGKDFRDGWFYAGPAVSDSGWQISAGGLFGVTVAKVEGLEVNVLGLVAGIDLMRPAIKLPGWGRIGLDPA
ncbi:DUF3750 domain-containing protein [Hartmannibacter diazotrophicus]|nr:DUF3750 domain-containing protein [Hartmannibacter diazotrophicus]